MESEEPYKACEEENNKQNEACSIRSGRSQARSRWCKQSQGKVYEIFQH